MAFQLLQEDTLYKQIITTSGGSYINGVWIKGTEAVSYEPIEGITEPYLKSEQSSYLPEGVSNTDSLILFSPDTLKTHQSLPNNSNLADVVFIEDPDTYPDAFPYVVWDKMVWKNNQGFALIDDYEEYILIREDRV